MKSFLILLIAGLGLGAVMMDKERQLAAPLKASVQAIAPQLRGGNGGIEPLQPASVRAAFTQQQVSTVHLAQFEEPEPQFRIIQGDSPAPPVYVTGRKVIQRCRGVIHFDLNGRAFCDEL